jgi:hypothetical protein
MFYFQGIRALYRDIQLPLQPKSLLRFTSVGVTSRMPENDKADKQTIALFELLIQRARISALVQSLVIDFGVLANRMEFWEAEEYKSWLHGFMRVMASLPNLKE